MEKNDKLLILGAGAWGTILGKVACDAHANPLLWTIEEEVENEINRFHTNYKYTGDVKLPRNLKATKSLEKALHNTKFILVAIPSISIPDVCKKIIKILSNKNIQKKYIWINVAKGLSPDNGTMTEYLTKSIPKEICGGVVSLIGPSLSGETAINQKTKVKLICKDIEIARQASKLFNNKYFSTVLDDDIFSNEYASILKNIYALFSGIVQGLGNEYNVLAITIVAVIEEMKKIIYLKGGNPDIVNGLTGLGDLIVTATNRKSRNFNSGYRIAKYNSVHEFIRRHKNKTIEGYYSCKTVYNSISQEDLKNLPVLSTLYNILYKKAKIKNSIDELLNNKDLISPSISFSTKHDKKYI